MKIDLTLNVGTVNQISEAAALKKKYDKRHLAGAGRIQSGWCCGVK